MFAARYAAAQAVSDRLWNSQILVKKTPLYSLKLAPPARIMTASNANIFRGEVGVLLRGGGRARRPAEAETGVAVVFRLCNANLTPSPPHLRAVIGYFLPVGGPTLAQNRSHFTQFHGIMPSRGRGRWLLSQFRYHVTPST